MVKGRVDRVHKEMRKFLWGTMRLVGIAGEHKDNMSTIEL